jgi:hypothetical protein
MKKLFIIVFVLAVVGGSVGAMYITENAGLVSGALRDLKFELQPGSPRLIGAPPQMKVTKATIDYLQQLMKDGKIVEVQNDGSIKVK